MAMFLYRLKVTPSGGVRLKTYPVGIQAISRWSRSDTSGGSNR